MRKVTISVPDNYRDFRELVRRHDLDRELDRFVTPTYLRFWIRDLFNDPELTDSEKEGITYSGIIHTIERAFSLSETIHNNPEGEAYAYIPYSPDYFLLLIKKALPFVRGKKVRFIDAGCGVGDKAELARFVFNIDASGVEYDGKLLDLANIKYRYPREHLHLIQGDITTFDFSPYNLIYAYNPINSENGMIAFFENVLRTAKAGTVCVFVNVITGKYAMDMLSDRFTPLEKTREWTEWCKIFRVKRRNK